jgi:GABA permease
VKMWAYPYLTLAVGVVLLVIIGGMAFDSGSRRSLVLTMLVTAIAVVAGIVQQRRHPHRPAVVEPAALAGES